MIELPLTPARLIEVLQLWSAPEVPERDDEKDKRRWLCRTVFSSDWHLGTPGAKIEEILGFMVCVRGDMCLVGDIIDCLMFPTYPRFPQLHLKAIFKLLKRACNGTKIVYVPGNHDDIVRDMAIRVLQDGEVPLLGNNIAVVPLHIHTTLEGEKFLVVHGDQVDGKLAFSRFWQVAGSHAYDWVWGFERRLNNLLRLVGTKKRVHFASWCKRQVKQLTRAYQLSFNNAIAELARAYGERYDVHIVGAIYGHTHMPGDVVVDGVRVINTGDWADDSAVGGCTAVVEGMDGIMGLVQWKDDEDGKPALYNFATGEKIPEGEVRFSPPEGTTEFAICA